MMSGWQYEQMVYDAELEEMSGRINQWEDECARGEAEARLYSEAAVYLRAAIDLLNKAGGKLNDAASILDGTPDAPKLDDLDEAISDLAHSVSVIMEMG
jgi:hypothetical protein